MRSFLSLLLVFTLSNHLIGQENPLQDELSRLLRSNLDSWTSKDSTGFKQTISEHYFVTQSGFIGSKAQLLQIITQKVLSKITDYSAELVTANDQIAYLFAKMVESSKEYGNTGVFCLATFQKENGAWKVAHSSFELVPAWKVKEPGDDELEPLEKNDCDTESESRSQNANVETFVRFKNESDQKVEVYWINYNEERQKYFELEPGKAEGGSTYVSHPWVIVSKDNECLGIYHPADKPGLVRIK